MRIERHPAVPSPLILPGKPGQLVWVALLGEVVIRLRRQVATRTAQPGRLCSDLPDSFHGNFAKAFRETKDHEGNPFWYQGLLFNEFYSSLDG